MKRTFLCLALFSLYSFSAMPQGRLDLSNQVALRRAKMAEKPLPQKKSIKMLPRDNRWSSESNQAFLNSRVTTAEEYFTPYPMAQQPMLAMVKLHEGSTAAELAADGFEVQSLREGFAIVTCQAADATRLAGHKAVKRCEFNRQRTFCMDKAREASGITTLQSGLGLPQAYTGKGVVTGIVDGGFDPNHVNFKDADGNTRFKYFATCEINSAGTGVRLTPYAPETLQNYSTDDNTQTHGTHTLGIMAGSFMGEATVGTYNETTDQAITSTMANPYYGVAYNSTIYASSGSSYDALIAYAVDGILEHRYYNDHNSPVVINLSLGGNQGPHDGSGILTQYFDAVAQGDGAILCLSAGNEGDMPISYHKTFTDGDTSFATFIRPYIYTDMRYGTVELYSDTAEDFDVSVILYNKVRKRVALTFPLNNKEGQIQYICSSSDYQQDDSDIINATFAKAYNGYVGVGGMLDEESGRFYAAIDYYVENSDENPANETTEAQYTIGFLVTGKSGQRVDVYCDGTYTALDSYGYEGYVDGMRNGSISDMATGKNTIAVGAYNTKVWAGNIFGEVLGYDGYYKDGEVTEFSSYGTLIDGRNLPHLVAPGSLVVSSLSTPYVNANGISEQIASEKYNDGKRNHYFYPMMGTSMSTPVVAGTVALMLEADPTLTYDKARDILIQTATMDDAVNKIEDPVQMGAGKLNALAAVKEVLRQKQENGIKGVTGDTPSRVLLSPQGHRSFSVFLADATTIQAVLYNTAGVKVLSATATGDEALLDVSSLSPGVYILKVNGERAERIIVK